MPDNEGWIMDKKQFDQLTGAAHKIVQISGELGNLKSRAPQAAKDIANYVKNSPNLWKSKDGAEVLRDVKLLIAHVLKVEKAISLALKSSKEIEKIMIDKKTPTLPIDEVKRKIGKTKTPLQEVSYMCGVVS